ncbi:hypothetical protein [Xenorhabdus bovienii]|uniref:hypothetical protein n=1 Tax=Xenorhabdus bovienii TaxID=40576 RepID=UPI00215863B3|nr:hypothetical protein [Xenorhabdus bovienii]
MQIDINELFKDYGINRKERTQEYLLLEKVHEENNWIDFSRDIEISNYIPDKLQEQFHLFWTERGAFIREKIANDQELTRLLRLLMPPYSGDGLELFRGENQERYQKGEIGFCWTISKEKAEQYARGLNSYHSGGVLLKCFAAKSAIIAGPHNHSVYLDEFEHTIDSAAIEDIDVMESFPISSVFTK